MSDLAHARMHDASVDVTATDGEIKRIQIPGTRAVLEIDMDALEAQAEELAAPGDFENVERENIGKPTLRRG